MQLRYAVFHDNTFEELQAIKACKFMVTMYPWRLNGCWTEIWSSSKKGPSTVILSAANPQIPVLQARSWCCTSPAKDVFPSCLVLPWHPQHPSYQARRHLNQSKGKTKRRLLLKIVKLTLKCGRCPENCLKLICADRLRTTTTTGAQVSLTGGTEGQKSPLPCRF